MKKLGYTLIIVAILAGSLFLYLQTEEKPEDLNMKEIRSQVKEFHESWNPGDYDHVETRGFADMDYIVLSQDGRNFDEMEEWNQERFQDGFIMAYEHGAISDTEPHLRNKKNYIIFYSSTHPESYIENLDKNMRKGGEEPAGGTVYYYDLENNKVKFFHHSVGPDVDI